MKPFVTLVGAGPGDAELLTIKAVKAIQSASLLLVDDLVSDEVVALAGDTTRVVYVGKRGGCKSTPQAFIEKLMVQSALEGEQVVRLKGGDPFIFGRGGEEVQALREHGIDVVVVNGITAGLAAVTSIGVPLTHRDHAHGVVFVTGHAKSNSHSTDWAALADAAFKAKLTLVIYMGISGIEEIQAGLLQGLPDHTPVAVVQNVSRPNQRQAVSQLSDLAALVCRQAFASPAVLVVGDVLQGLAVVEQSKVRALA